MSESRNRIHFESLSKRLRKVSVDIVHKVTVKADEKPQVGPRGSFFNDELYKLKSLDIAGHYKRFYSQMNPLVRSITKLMRNQTLVIDLLEKTLNQIQPDESPSYFNLINVLGR